MDFFEKAISPIDNNSSRSSISSELRYWLSLLLSITLIHFSLGIIDLPPIAYSPIVYLNASRPDKISGTSARGSVPIISDMLSSKLLVMR